MEAVADLASVCDEVIILRGNHDGLDENLPYFAFLNAIPKVRFVVKPQFMKEERILLLPHTRTPDDDWKERDIVRAKYILLHATVTGSVSESGQKLEGVSRNWFLNTSAKIYAGDIHVPQTIGTVEYVGAPYHVRFGDSFEPRVIHINDSGKARSIKTDNIRRHTLTISDPEELAAKALFTKAGDQLKVRIKLTKTQYADWQKYKKEVSAFCKANGLELTAVELEREVEQALVRPALTFNTKRNPVDLLRRYCKAKGIPQTAQELGELLLGGTT